MKVIGLMSGTSMDGITAALTQIDGAGGKIKAELLKYETTPYPDRIRGELLELTEGGSVKDLCRLNFVLGQLFAEAAEGLLSRESHASLIGSHGQTVCHLPKYGPDETCYTLQIGEPDVIAERTGITTIADFRPRDVAAGGEGAPLIPYVDYALFHSEEKNRLALNLGGIANVTYLPAGGALNDLLAFDTGPANMVLDELVRRLTDGKKDFDKDGELAREGEVDTEILDWMMEHPFIRRSPPKSTGRRDFGKEYAERVLERASKRAMNEVDIIATATAFTVNSIEYGCSNFLGEVDELIAAGGGTRNDFLMEMLARVTDYPVKTSDDFGIASEAKEAVGFAVLARETYLRRPNNVPGATGAKHSVVLGKISPGGSESI